MKNNYTEQLYIYILSFLLPSSWTCSPSQAIHHPHTISITAAYLRNFQRIRTHKQYTDACEDDPSSILPLNSRNSAVSERFSLQSLRM